MSDLEHISGPIDEARGILARPVCEETEGDFEYESDALKVFDAAIEANEFGLFRENIHEVWGEYRRVPPGVDFSKRPRIDRVVMPSAKLMELGWGLGPIFIEAKRWLRQPARDTGVR